jgi:hypothetical protein
VISLTPRILAKREKSDDIKGRRGSQKTKPVIRNYGNATLFVSSECLKWIIINFKRNKEKERKKGCHVPSLE